MSSKSLCLYTKKTWTSDVLILLIKKNLSIILFGLYFFYCITCACLWFLYILRIIILSKCKYESYLKFIVLMFVCRLVVLRTVQFSNRNRCVWFGLKITNNQSNQTNIIQSWTNGDSQKMKAVSTHSVEILVFNNHFNLYVYLLNCGSNF